MKILVFSELFLPHGSGAELATWLYLKLLAEKGFKITVVTTRFPNEPAEELLNDGITVFRMPMRTFESRYDSLVNAGVTVSSFVRKMISNSDVVYVPGCWHSIIPVAKVLRKPLVVHVHNYFITCSTSLMYDFIEQKIRPSSSKSFVLYEIAEMKRKPLSVFASSLINTVLGRFYNRLATYADALVFVSKAQRNLVLSEVPYIREKSKVIYNPIPNDPFIETEDKGIGYFGGKNFVKGFYVLMRALKSLSYKHDVKTYMTKISEKKKTVRISHANVNFLPKLNPNSFLDIMKKISITVIPSLWAEPLAYAVVDSMLYGKLVVASKIGGIPEILEGYTQESLGVRLTSPGDHKEISDSLHSFLMLDLEETNEIGIKNREHILRRFNNEKTVKSFINLLDKVA